MEKVNEPKDRRDAIDSTAAAWVARLGDGPLSDAEQRDLDHWLSADPLHGAVFDEARAAWEKMGQVHFAPGVLADDVAPQRRTPPAGTTDRRRHSLWLRTGALVACLLVLAGGARFWLGDPVILLTADHRTAPGERHGITLSDGSTVELGPDSAIAVRYDDTERRIDLLTGLAYFTAAPLADGERRPFVVAAANGTARALGTQFLVDRMADGVQVVVIEHTVEVALATPSGERTQAMVAPGRAVGYDATGLGQVRPANLDHAMAWRRGRLIVDHAPLGEVVAALNRHRRGRVVIADPALAAREVSGVFDVTDPDAALAVIARDLQIATASLPPLVTLLY